MPLPLPWVEYTIHTQTILELESLKISEQVTMRGLSLIALAPAALGAPNVPRAAPVDALVGYGASATGGGSGSGTTVTSCSAFTTAAEAGGVIKISGVLDGCGIVDLVSDTSVIGVGAKSGQ